MQSKTMDFNKISKLQHECHRIIKWFQVHKKSSWFNDWTSAFTKQSLSILQKEKKEELEHFHTPIMFQWQMNYNYYTFFQTTHFSILNLERNTLILYTLKELLHMKKNFLIRLLIFTIWKLFKVSYAETVLEIK